MQYDDYVKQLEESNLQLKQKLEEIGQLVNTLEDDIRQRDGHTGVVIACQDELQIEKPSFLEVTRIASLIVVPAQQYEVNKIFANYQISPDVNLKLYKSIKDRNNRTGGFYDTSMLKDYSSGKSVKPYVI